MVKLPKACRQYIRIVDEMLPGAGMVVTGAAVLE